MLAAKDFASCLKFRANIFNKSKCQDCFRPREAHPALDEELAQAKPLYGGWLCLAPEGTDFGNSLQRSRKWQRRFFLLCERGDLRYALDAVPSTLPQGVIGMAEVTEVADAESHTGQRNSLCIATLERTYYVRAETKEDISGWHEVLVPYVLVNKQTLKKRNVGTSLPQEPIVAKVLAAGDAYRPGAADTVPSRPGNYPGFPTFPQQIHRSRTHGGVPRSASASSLVPTDACEGRTPEGAAPSGPPEGPAYTPSAGDGAEAASPGPGDGKGPSQARQRFPAQGAAASTAKDVKPRLVGVLPPERRAKSLDRRTSEATMTPDLLNFKQGWLMRLDEDEQWRKHWFVLTDSGLKFYKDSMAEEALDEDGEIELTSCYGVAPCDTQRNYGFQIHTADGVFTLSAMTAGIRKNWVQSLSKNVQPLSSPDLSSAATAGGATLPDTAARRGGQPPPAGAPWSPLPAAGAGAAAAAANPLLVPAGGRGPGRHRRREGRSRTLDLADLQPLREALRLQSRRQCRPRAKTSLILPPGPAAPGEPGTSGAPVAAAGGEPGEDPRPSASTGPDGTGPRPPGDEAGAGGRPHGGALQKRRSAGRDGETAPPPVAAGDAKPGAGHDEIEQRWAQVETTPPRDDRQVPIATLGDRQAGPPASPPVGRPGPPASPPGAPADELLQLLHNEVEQLRLKLEHAERELRSLRLTASGGARGHGLAPQVGHGTGDEEEDEEAEEEALDQEALLRARAVSLEAESARLRCREQEVANQLREANRETERLRSELERERARRVQLGRALRARLRELRADNARLAEALAAAGRDGGGGGEEAARAAPGGESRETRPGGEDAEFRIHRREAARAAGPEGRAEPGDGDGGDAGRSGEEGERDGERAGARDRAEAPPQRSGTASQTDERPDAARGPREKPARAEDGVRSAAADLRERAPPRGCERGEETEETEEDEETEESSAARVASPEPDAPGRAAATTTEADADATLAPLPTAGPRGPEQARPEGASHEAATRFGSREDAERGRDEPRGHPEAASAQPAPGLARAGGEAEPEEALPANASPVPAPASEPPGAEAALGPAGLAARPPRAAAGRPDERERAGDGRLDPARRDERERDPAALPPTTGRAAEADEGGGGAEEARGGARAGRAEDPREEPGEEDAETEGDPPGSSPDEPGRQHARDAVDPERRPRTEPPRGESAARPRAPSEDVPRRARPPAERPERETPGDAPRADDGERDEERGAAEREALARLAEDLHARLGEARAELRGRPSLREAEAARARHRADTDALKGECERALLLMEESHRRALRELQQAHRRTVAALGADKERLLAEETAATIAAIEAVKAAYREELETLREARADVVPAGAAEERARHQEDVASLRREVEALSEQYSHKSLQAAHLLQALEAERAALTQSRRHNHELNARNQKLGVQLARETRELPRETGRTDGSTEAPCAAPSALEMQVAVRVKESEIQFLTQELRLLKEELHAAQRDKKLAAHRYKDMYRELSLARTHAQRDARLLQDKLRRVSQQQQQQPPVAPGHRTPAQPAQPSQPAPDVLKSRSNTEGPRTGMASGGQQLKADAESFPLSDKAQKTPV